MLGSRARRQLSGERILFRRRGAHSGGGKFLRHVVAERYGVRPGMYVDYDNKRHKIIGLYNGEHGRDFVTLNTEQVQEVSG